MINIICVVLFCIFVLVITNLRIRQINREIIEKFEEKDELFHLSQKDKDLYFEIIDTYTSLVNRAPDEHELNLQFNEIKSEKIRVKDLVTTIKKSEEYRRINDTFDNLSYAPANTSSAFKEKREFHQLVEQLFPKNEFTPEFNEYIFSKYKQLDREESVFVKYVRETPEYKEYEKRAPDKNIPTKTKIKIQKKTKKTKKTHNAVIEEFEDENIDDDNDTITSEDDTYSVDGDEIVAQSSEIVAQSREIVAQSREIVAQSSKLAAQSKDTEDVEVEISGEIVAKIDRPSTQTASDLSEKGFHMIMKKHKDIKDKEKSCEHAQKTHANLDESHILSKTRLKRNMDDLKYQCEMSKEYKNVDSKLTLLKDQKWSVPQKHTPVCYSQTCDVQNRYEQSALIGTVLDDGNNNILPKFSFTEEDVFGV